MSSSLTKSASMASAVSVASGASTDGPVEDDNELALKGVRLLFNSHWDEGVALFDKYKGTSTIMYFGGVFVSFMQAMMTLEDDKIEAARRELEEAEKRCDGLAGGGNVFRRLRNKMKGGDGRRPSREDRWTAQIIVADTLLYQAVLTFVNQELPSYMKGGWILRRAWKIYEKVYKDVKRYHDLATLADVGQGSSVDGEVNSGAAAVVVVDDDEADDVSGENGRAAAAAAAASAGGKGGGHGTGKQAAAGTADPQQHQQPAATSKEHERNAGGGCGGGEAVSREALARLLGAVSFGYGLFQLGLSMIPDKVLKLIEFLGFEADREAGLAAVEYSSTSSDMRSPLAIMTLLWWHAIMKPFFSVDERGLSDADEAAASDAIARFEGDYPDSAMFAFFRGRLCRLRSDVGVALQRYELALAASANHREMQLAAVFEISWCRMMLLDYAAAHEGFLRLQSESRWSTATYAYLRAVCAGSLGRLDEAADALRSVPGLVKRKGNQLEAFVSRRALQFKKRPVTSEACEMLVLELVYLWNCVPQLSRGEQLDRLLAACSRLDDKQLYHVRSLVEGAIYKRNGDTEFAMQCFQEAIARQEGMKCDQHIAAHATFEIGMTQIREEATRASGRKLLLKARDGFKEYDFENRLSVRIRSALKTWE